MFHSSSHSPTARTNDTESPPFTHHMLLPDNYGHPNSYGPQGYGPHGSYGPSPSYGPSVPYGPHGHWVPFTQNPTTPAPAASPSTPLAPASSDPPDADMANPYPTIDDFITKLHERAPKRGLASFLFCFESQDYYHIDEVSRINAKDLEGPGFSLTAGNAAFLLAEVEKEIKRVDHMARRAKKARRD